MEEYVYNVLRSANNSINKTVSTGPDYSSTSVNTATYLMIPSDILSKIDNTFKGYSESIITSIKKALDKTLSEYKVPEVREGNTKPKLVKSSNITPDLSDNINSKSPSIDIKSEGTKPSFNYAQYWENLKSELGEDWSKDNIIKGSIDEVLSELKSKFDDNNDSSYARQLNEFVGVKVKETSEGMSNEVRSYLTDVFELPSRVLDSAVEVTKQSISSVFDSILYLSTSVTRGVKSSTVGSVKNILNSSFSGASKIISTATDAGLSIANEAITDVSKWVGDQVQDKVTSKIDSGVNTVISGINSKTQEVRNNIFKAIYEQDTEPPLKFPTRKEMGISDYIIATTGSWMMSVSSYTYPEGSGDTPPEINKYFNNNSNTLPIISYSFNGEQLLNSTVPLYSSSSFQIPSGFMKPSSISVTFPQVYVRGREYDKEKSSSGPSMLRWKKDFMKYALCDDLNGNKVRNFRLCTYKIQLCRYQYKNDSVTNFMENYIFYGVPTQIGISHYGSEMTEAQNYDTIEFSIVGDNYTINDINATST